MSTEAKSHIKISSSFIFYECQVGLLIPVEPGDWYLFPKACPLRGAAVFHDTLFAIKDWTAYESALRALPSIPADRRSPVERFKGKQVHTTSIKSTQSHIPVNNWTEKGRKSAWVSYTWQSGGAHTERLFTRGSELGIQNPVSSVVPPQFCQPRLQLICWRWLWMIHLEKLCTGNVMSSSAGGSGPLCFFKSILSCVVVVSENEAGRKALQCAINGKLLFSFETCDEQNTSLKCFVALMPYWNLCSPRKCCSLDASKPNILA